MFWCCCENDEPTEFVVRTDGWTLWRYASDYSSGSGLWTHGPQFSFDAKTRIGAWQIGATSGVLWAAITQTLGTLAGQTITSATLVLRADAFATLAAGPHKLRVYVEDVDNAGELISYTAAANAFNSASPPKTPTSGTWLGPVTANLVSSADIDITANVQAWLNRPGLTSLSRLGVLIAIDTDTTAVDTNLPSRFWVDGTTFGPDPPGPELAPVLSNYVKIIV